MRKTIFLLLSVALILGSCTPSEPDLKKTEYLKLVHSTVDMTSAKADKTLTQKGFVQTNQSIKQNGIEALICDRTYAFQSKDSSIILLVGLKLSNDSVKQYIIEAKLTGDVHKTDAQKLYNEWSNYAYKTIFQGISLWSANWFASDNLGDFGDLYMDGTWAVRLKNLLTLYFQTGGMDEEAYDAIMAAFDRKHEAWEAEMASADFLQEDGDLFESFIHASQDVDITALFSGDPSSLKGIFGTSSTHISSKDGVKKWDILFLYLNEQDLSKVMEDLPF